MPNVQYRPETPIHWPLIMFFWQFLISLASGGLAGGCISIIANRLFHRRALRTEFYPKVVDLFSAYAVRIEQPEGRYWKTTVGLEPAPGDEEFVSHRARFLVSDVVRFNELREARELRKRLAATLNPQGAQMGSQIITDLVPDMNALHECVKILHKKLKLD